MKVKTLASRLAAVIIVLSLAWLAVSETVASLLAAHLPDLVLSIRSGSSEALEHQAQTLLGTPQAVPAITAAMPKAPLDAALLGQLAGQTQNQDWDRSQIYLDLASKMTRRDTSVEQTIYYRALGANDFPTAYQALDMLLRQRAVAERLVLADLDAKADNPQARAALARVMATNPPWRASVLGNWTRSTDKQDAALALYDELSRIGSPATTAERSNLVQLLANSGQFSKAHEMSGAAGAGLLTDGDFKGSSVLEPFNWSLQPAGVVTAEISAASNGQRGLNVTWPANQTTDLTRQLTILPPGNYRLSGLVAVDKIAHRGWLRWLMICASDQVQLGEAREIAASGWHDFSTVFTVPANCPAVWLGLSSLAGDGDGFASAWYQRLSLTPISASEAADARKSQP